MIRCIFFDRDGTLGALKDKRYPTTFVPYFDIKALFLMLKQRGYTVGILTNQSSIARGTAGNYDFAAEFIKYGADLWEICPHDTNDCCNCRKPKSGLLLSACSRLGISPNECLMIGDRHSDILCAKNVGAYAALVLTGYGENEKQIVLRQFPAMPILDNAWDVLKML